MIPTLQLGQSGRANIDEPTTDQFFSSVVLLVDASARADGSTPSDIDVKGKTPTWRGNARCKTDQYKFGSSSLYFDGSNDRISFADSADWAMGTGDATWELWVRPESAHDITRVCLSQATAWGSLYSAQLYRYDEGGIYGLVSNGATAYYGGALGLTTGVWTHIALVRHGANLYLYVNGALSTLSTALSGVSLMDSAGAMTVGAYFDGDDSRGHWKGWIDQVRITKGVARYTAPYVVVPTAKFPHS